MKRQFVKFMTEGYGEKYINVSFIKHIYPCALNPSVASTIVLSDGAIFNVRGTFDAIAQLLNEQ